MNNDAEAKSAADYARFPGLPPFEHRAIGAEKRLWHGRNPLTAWDVETLRREGITHLLDLREPEEWSGTTRLGAEAVETLDAKDSGIIRKHVSVRDVHSPTGTGFADATAFITDSLAVPGSRVFVHCRLGRERTGAVLAAYYAVANNVSVVDALRELNAQSAALFPQPHQIVAAQEWVDARRGTSPERR